jgi:hypothetical protein
VGSLSNPPTPGAGGPFGSAYTQTYSTKARTQAKTELSESVTIALLTEVAGQFNTTNAAVNELKKLINGVIDDLQEGKILS